MGVHLERKYLKKNFDTLYIIKTERDLKRDLDLNLTTKTFPRLPARVDRLDRSSVVGMWWGGPVFELGSVLRLGAARLSAY